MALSDILRSAPVRTGIAASAIALGALTATPKTVEAQERVNASCTVLVDGYRPVEGFWDRFKAGLDAWWPFNDDNLYRRRGGQEAVQGRTTVPTPSCDRPDINVQLKGTDGSVRTFNERAPGLFVTRIAFNPNSGTCYSFEPTTPATNITIPPGNPNTERWLRGDNCFSGRELGNRSYTGWQGPVIVASRGNGAEVYVVEAVPLRSEAPPRQAPAPQPREQPTRTIPAPQPEQPSIRTPLPQRLAQLHVAESVARGGTPDSVRYILTDSEGTVTTSADYIPRFQTILNPDSLSKGVATLETIGFFPNGIASDISTTNVARGRRTQDTVPELARPNYISVGAAGVMEATDISNGTYRERHFTQDLSGLRAGAQATINNGPAHVEASASYTRLAGEQNSGNTENRSDVTRNEMDARLYALLSTSIGLGAAAELGYSRATIEERLHENEGEPLHTTSGHTSALTAAAGVGYERDGFNAAAMLARQSQPDGYSWNETRSGIIARFGYDGVATGKKYSFEGRLSRLEGEMAPPGFQDYVQQIDASLSWNPLPNVTLSGTYRNLQQDGPERISTQQYGLGVKLNL